MGGDVYGWGEYGTARPLDDGHGIGCTISLQNTCNYTDCSSSKAKGLRRSELISHSGGHYLSIVMVIYL